VGPHHDVKNCHRRTATICAFPRRATRGRSPCVIPAFLTAWTRASSSTGKLAAIAPPLAPPQLHVSASVSCNFPQRLGTIPAQRCTSFPEKPAPFFPAPAFEVIATPRIARKTAFIHRPGLPPDSRLPASSRPRLFTDEKRFEWRRSRGGRSSRNLTANTSPSLGRGRFAFDVLDSGTPIGKPPHLWPQRHPVKSPVDGLRRFLFFGVSLTQQRDIHDSIVPLITRVSPALCLCTPPPLAESSLEARGKLATGYLASGRDRLMVCTALGLKTRLFNVHHDNRRPIANLRLDQETTWRQADKTNTS